MFPTYPDAGGDDEMYANFSSPPCGRGEVLEDVRCRLVDSKVEWPRLLEYTGDPSRDSRTPAYYCNMDIKGARCINKSLRYHPVPGLLFVM